MDELIFIYKRLQSQSSGSMQFAVSNCEQRKTTNYEQMRPDQTGSTLCSQLLSGNRWFDQVSFVRS